MRRSNKPLVARRKAESRSVRDETRDREEVHQEGLRASRVYLGRVSWFSDVRKCKSGVARQMTAPVGKRRCLRVVGSGPVYDVPPDEETLQLASGALDDSILFYGLFR